jgi:5-methylcytosine-specific restriction endonuclease McrA
MKICKVCLIEKSKTEFYISKINKDGLVRLCKPCSLEEGRKYREANSEKMAQYRIDYYIDNKDRIDARNKQYRLDHLKEEKSYKARYSIKNKASIAESKKRYRIENKEYFAARGAAYYRANKSRLSAYQEIYRNNNKDRIARLSRRWQKENPEKVRANQSTRRARKILVGGKHTGEDIKRLMLMQKGKCACCRSKIKGKKYDADHHMPLKLGGSNDASNIQLLCPSCNRSKNSRHPVDFMRSRGFLI